MPGSPLSLLSGPIDQVPALVTSFFVISSHLILSHGRLGPPPEYPVVEPLCHHQEDQPQEHCAVGCNSAGPFQVLFRDNLSPRGSRWWFCVTTSEPPLPTPHPPLLILRWFPRLPTPVTLIRLGLHLTRAPLPSPPPPYPRVGEQQGRGLHRPQAPQAGPPPPPPSLEMV